MTSRVRPLAGRGLVAPRGGLVALTDGMDAGPDPLLTALVGGRRRER